MLGQELRDVAKYTHCPDEYTRGIFLSRIEEEKLTRDENPKTHFCVYFLPYNPKTREVFFVHHKKSGLWLSPGGHIDKNETLFEAVNREIAEELGMKQFFTKKPDPFLLTTVGITDPRHPCDRHYDIWYLVRTDGSTFQVDPIEFHTSSWMTIDEALSRTKDPSNAYALKYLLQRGEKHRQ